MSHFPEREWWDFALDHVSPPQRELMQIHLNGGCGQCQRLLERWLQASELFRRETSFQPPDGAVRIVKSAFLPSNRHIWLPQIAEFARLLFDSGQKHNLAHVRGSIQTNRHLLHETGSFTVDLRVETEPGAKRVHLLGQILNSKEPTAAIKDAPVTLLGMGAESVFLESRTNFCGEFDLELAEPDNWQLFIELQDHSPVGIRLTR
jgi:hypothetical protein